LAHKSRTKVPEIPKVVGKLPTPLAITSTRFEVKRSKVKVTRPINAETESVSPTNFKLGRRLEDELSKWPPINACEVGFLHAGWGICRVGRSRRPYNLFVFMLFIRGGTYRAMMQFLSSKLAIAIIKDIRIIGLYCRRQTTKAMHLILQALSRACKYDTILVRFT